MIEPEAAGLQRQGTRLSVGGVTVEKLCDALPTPFYVVDASSVRQRLRRLRNSFIDCNVTVFYAVKAYANVELLRLLRSLDVGVDVCSEGDLLFAERAGLTQKAVSYTSVAMSGAEIDLVVKKDVFFVASSIDQLHRYGERAPGRAVGLRVNPSIAAGFHPAVMAAAASSKFGVPVSQVPLAMKTAQLHELEVIALHAHLGSDLLSPRPHLELLQTLVTIARAVPSVQIVDVGGGWGIPFTDEESEYDVEEFGRQVRAALAAEVRPFAIRVEPGSYLVRAAGFLVTTVTEIAQRGSRLLIGVDTSTNHLPGTLLFGTQHPCYVDGADDASEMTLPTCVVVGNLMQGGDVLLDGAQLGPLEVGDHLVFALVGAYSSVRATTFNERPRPAEVLVDQGRATLVRRAESPEDLLRHQECVDLPLEPDRPSSALGGGAV